MKTKICFTKMHGAGNDYIYVNTMLYPISDPAEAARQWSAPHTGIGSDGLVLIGAPREAENDFSMRIFNADGSEAMMCGNASRCIGKYLYERGLTRKTSIRLETLSGVKTLQLDVEGDEVKSVTVDMLEPLTIETRELTVEGKTFAGTYVSMGNPHFVTMVDKFITLPPSFFTHYGSLLERHSAFPDRCNIEFVEILSPDCVRVRVWERGSGITQACGTGACATAVACASWGKTSREVDVVMDGGTLHVDWRRDDHVYLSGPAEFVFDGQSEINEK